MQAEHTLTCRRIYTKRGDEGVSDLYTGERRSKTDVVFNALGDLDEVHSCLLGYAGHAQA